MDIHRIDESCRTCPKCNADKNNGDDDDDRMERTNQDIDERREHNGEISAQVGIRYEGSQQGKDRRNARPQVHVPRRAHRRLAQQPRQIRYQIPRYPEIREPLRYFNPCTHQKHTYI